MTKREFIARSAPYAVLTDTVYGVPASITLAQAALESGYGDSQLARKANNYFGIKGEGETFVTKELNPKSGQLEKTEDSFRTYGSKLGSFIDHANLISEGRYEAVKDASPSTAATILQERGYATDPNYADKLRRVMREHDLSRFDRYAPILRAIGALITAVVLFYVVRTIIQIAR